eukprot:1147996-Pelagomonas_calceolata.AAC.3
MLPFLRESALRAKTRQGSPGANVPMPAIVMVRDDPACANHAYFGALHACCAHPRSSWLVLMQVNSFAARIPLKNMSIYTASKHLTSSPCFSVTHGFCHTCPRNLPVSSKSNLHTIFIYNAQYALVGFTDVLRDELRGSGIFVGTVNPGKGMQELSVQRACALLQS